MRVSYSDLFESRPDGSVVSKVPLRVGSVWIPQGFAINPAVSLAGIEVGAARGLDLEVQPEGEGYRLLDAF